MKIEIRRIEPTATEPETWLGAPDLTPANVWEDDIEHADFGSGELAGRGRRVWLATGLVLTVVAIGILGRFVPGTAVHPSRHRIFFPAAFDRGENVTGRSTIRTPLARRLTVISGSMSNRSAVSLRPRARSPRIIL